MFLPHTHTRTQGRDLDLGSVSVSVSVWRSFQFESLCAQHAIKCFCLINKKINFYETCLKQTTKIDWPDKMQLRFAKPTHTHTYTHSHTPIHSPSLSKKCARACGLTVSSLLPESFVFLSSFGDCCQRRHWRCAVCAVSLPIVRQTIANCCVALLKYQQKY